MSRKHRKPFTVPDDVRTEMLLHTIFGSSPVDTLLPLCRVERCTQRSMLGMNGLCRKHFLADVP